MFLDFVQLPRHVSEDIRMGPGPPLLASVKRTDCGMSSGSSSKSKIWKFSFMRAGAVDLGKMTSPR